MRYTKAVQMTPTFLRRIPEPVWLVLATVGVGVLAGATTSLLPFWAGFLGLAVLAGATLVLSDVRLCAAAMFAIATILPFATLPFRAVVTPSLLNLALLAFSALWLLQVLTTPGARLRLTPLGLPLLGFLGLTLFALLLGSGLNPGSQLLHSYFKFVCAVLVFFSITHLVTTDADARWLIRALILSGGVSALIGLVIYITPDDLALRLLVALGRIGYPESGRVLRFVEDDTAGIERAIGLAVDPNSFGGMLALVGALAATQLVAERPVIARRWLAPIVGAILLALFLTYSRAALAGMIVAAMYVATLRYRRLWWVILAAGALAALLFTGLGVGEQFMVRITEGVQFRDQANQMRLAEFANAIAIIQAYPVFGIGFGSAPELDLTAGVSSIYLAIAQRTGLVGLAAFLGLMALFFGRSLRALATASASGAVERASWLVSLQAAVASALTVGLLDHYFFNIEFSHMAALLWGVIGIATALEDQ